MRCARAMQKTDWAASLHARVVLCERVISFSSVIIHDPRKVHGIPDSASSAYIVMSKLGDHFVDLKRKLSSMAICFLP